MANDETVGGGLGLLTESIGAIVVAAVGLGAAYLLYRGSNELLYPETHSKFA